MRARLWFIFLLLGFCALGAIFCVIMSFTGHVSINGHQFEDFTEDKIISELTEINMTNEPIFYETDLNKKFVSYNFDLSNLADENLFIAKLLRKSYDVTYTTSLNFNLIDKYIDNLNASADKPINAKIKKGTSQYVVESEKQGDFIDKGAVLADLGTESRNFKFDKYYTEPTVTTEDLQPELDRINSHVLWTVNYKNGFTIKSSLKNVKKEKDGYFVFNTEWLRGEITKLAESYNTVGKTKKFKTIKGKKKKISGGTWGIIIDEEKEFEKLASIYSSEDKISNLNDVEPEYYRDQKKIGKKYIEVDLTNQVLYYIKNKKVKMTTSIVSGCTGKKKDTPTGMYYISEKVNGKYLIGDDYKTWVNKWMRLTNTGVGLHDAYWRGAFGGSIYKYNGSHGCVNLPKAFAYSLYDKVDVGLPVIIYK